MIEKHKSFSTFDVVLFILFVYNQIENTLEEEKMNEKVKYVVVLGAFIILSIIGYFSLPRDEIVIQASNDETKEIEYIYVHIEGCVLCPGIYSVPYGTRLYELIEIAGGETHDADVSRINLASILTDAQKVYVPAMVIYEQNNESAGGISNGIVNINIATLEELQTLDGIGPSMAKRIMEYRESNGYFLQIEDIMNVDGIGESKFNKIKEQITI